LARWALALCVAWLASGAPLVLALAGPPPVVAESRAGDSGRDRLVLWIGGGLAALGLAGGAIAAFLDQRRRLQGARSQLATLHAELEVLNAEIGQRQRRLDSVQTEMDQQRQSVESLRESERRFRTLTEQLPVGVFLTDAQGAYRYVNDRWRQLAGLTAEQALESGWSGALHPEDRERVLSAWRQAIEGGAEFAIEHRFRTSSGRETWLNTRAVPLRDRAGNIAGYLGAHTDIADLKQSEETLRASEARFRGYFELPLVGIALTGPDKRWWEVNDRLCEMLGYRRTQLLRLSWAELTYPEDLAIELAQFDRVMSRRIEGYSLDKRFVRQDGEILHVSVSTRCLRRANGVVEYFVTVVQDITERKQAEERAQHLAQYDALTGLPNRTLLTDRLQQAVLRAGRDHSQMGVLLVDLDHFKRINDALGHTVGDQLLRELATRLQECVRPFDTISRQGGDEFAVLLPDLEVTEEAARIAERILDIVAQPCRINDQELRIGCSIGISIYPRDGRNAEMLLKNADTALYRAKDMGRNSYQYYLSGATMIAHERLRLEASLRYAVDRQQLELYYQPKWDFRTGSITGAEALVRWNHPELGLLPPGRFITIAEDSGLILPIGEWVLRNAVRDVSRLHGGGFPKFEVAVNLSGRQFRQAGLADLVGEALAETGFDANCLELELTEGILMNPTEENLGMLKAFKTVGARIAIDDFGTGYSSLSYLQRFPVDVLKIDRSFVVDLPASTDSAAIVDAIVALAHGLGLEVVAEGVETAEQSAFLRARGCDKGQGYYFGRPLPLVELRKLLVQDRLKTAPPLAPPPGLAPPSARVIPPA
jgi:diguanylate cyclase (GGDEF)-like protein/PAS domain S-box-containing protein